MPSFYTFFWSEEMIPSLGPGAIFIRAIFVYNLAVTSLISDQFNPVESQLPLPNLIGHCHSVCPPFSPTVRLWHFVQFKWLFVCLCEVDGKLVLFAFKTCSVKVIGSWNTVVNNVIRNSLHFDRIWLFVFSCVVKTALVVVHSRSRVLTDWLTQSLSLKMHFLLAN